MKRLVLLAASLCLLIAGCAPAGRITLRLGIFSGSAWDVNESVAYELIEEAICRFEAAHPGVDVVYESGIRVSDYPEWLDNAVIMGQEPDVFALLDEDFGKYASLGVLHNLDPFIRQDETVSATTFFAAAAESGKYQYSQYALPFLMNPRMMFVNVSLLKQEGLPVPDGSWTPEEFLDLCQSVTRDTDGDGITDQFGCVDYHWLDLAEAYGLDLFAADGSGVDLNQETVKRTLQMYRDMQAYMADAQDRETLMEAGQVAFSPMSYAEFITYNPYPWKIKKYTDFEWICVELPESLAPGIRYTGGSVLMGMNADTRHAELAWELMKEFCEDEMTQTALLQRSQGMCARQIGPMVLHEYLETSGLSSESAQSMLNREGGRIRFAKYEPARDLLGTRMEEAASGNTDLDLALIEIENEVRIYLRS